MQTIIGIDVGGTFTDFVSFDPGTGALKNWKNLTTPQNPIEGILEGLRQVEHLNDVGRLRLGTTLATNALLTRTGARVGYVTTEGFRDVPFIQRGDRRGHYDVTWIKTKPLVKRKDCHEVSERLTVEGDVLIPLDEAKVRELGRRLREDGVEAVAVCTLFSYVDPAHERRIGDILAEELGDIPISISYDVLPKWKEYERASTTIADAYLKPIVTRGFREMESQLDSLGVGSKLRVIKSNGGECTVTAAMNSPAEMMMSGPTGAVVASRALAAVTGFKDLVTFDMGGTSTDVSAVVEGSEHVITSFEIEWGVPIQVPMIDIHSIGAGGGSIAWIDKGGMLRVGPKSAGAIPGPACYGRGGTEATVTDANVVLGRINPDYFLGGRIKLDEKAARAAVTRIGDQLGMSTDEVAFAIVEIINNNMNGALRTVLRQRGLDPRDFSLVASGGAGPVHTCDLMTIANIPRSIVPNFPGQFSAFGFIMTDARIDRQRTARQTSRAFDMARATRAMTELVGGALAELNQQGYATGITIHRSIEARYLGQNHELEVTFPGDVFDERTTQDLWNRFHTEHEARFGFSIPGEVIETVNLKAVVIASDRKPEIRQVANAGGTPTPLGRRRVRFASGWLEIPVYNRELLSAGNELTGPAVIEENASVTILNAGQMLSIDKWGNMIITAQAQH